ncbi:hypothetical protein TTHERM_00925520 (macronuclear) [Tetrahymena thermophila SB210]|uniref:Uncharacterized protein n=1 Tax=Tetrahymena thermophila (strain SB210) TaxID=312017 RepID=Q22E07_TETTS|nr:hypothetical protein TTHERM_00925520 [Tetrahymena thermophila SB210]EAR83505.1 hypothetical protein TTHERM_00925520 [Tetrahymena thermophila SB210]|eukprot:XP_001031168.1 hypothetical protein TTHERM_00925520 [Tetrahymena thermophila SB210]
MPFVAKSFKKAYNLHVESFKQALESIARQSIGVKQLKLRTKSKKNIGKTSLKAYVLEYLLNKKQAMRNPVEIQDKSEHINNEIIQKLLPILILINLLSI